MAGYIVDVYAFFVNGAHPRINIRRVKQDISRANEAWRGCVKFTLQDIYFSKANLIINANSIPSEKVFKHKQIDSLVKAARKAAGRRTGIYVFYVGGDYLAEGRGKRVVGVGGTELVSFKSSTDYELFGRILLTDGAAGRYTLAHEFGHILFKRYNTAQRTFTHDDPSGPYVHAQTRRRDAAHNNDRKNLMFPISPSINPIITPQQCQTARRSKIAKAQNDEMVKGYKMRNVYFF
ncbi:MAG TPA: hypothetical protein VNM45_06645 [Bacillus sp. (in: firmicutes)]|nr:hypothetical protein [Bacillus sp. (in: firmicutes)]